MAISYRRGCLCKGVKPSAHYELPLKTFSVGTSAMPEEINKKRRSRSIKK